MPTTIYRTSNERIEKMTFSEKLVILRKIKSLTQDEFASAVGVSRQAVYKWESGQSYPEVSKLLEIKLLFGISIDDLLDDTFEIALPEKKKRKRAPKVKEAPSEKVVITPPEAEEGEITVAAPVVNEAVTYSEMIEEKAEINVEAEEVASSENEEKDEVTAASVEEKAEEPAAEVKKEITSDEKESDAEAAADAEPKKRGLFGRLFGKK